MDRQQLIGWLHELLKGERFNHSLLVAEQAEKLARIHGADTEKAWMAGVLHDCCKQLEDERLLQIIADSGIILDDATRHSPGLWHSIAASVFIPQQLPIQDEGILFAIRYHTSARADMSLLEQIIYLADLTSADRCYPDIGQMRGLAQTSLPQAMRYALTYIVGELVAQNKPICLDTYYAYHQYCALYQGGSSCQRSS